PAARGPTGGSSRSCQSPRGPRSPASGQGSRPRSVRQYPRSRQSCGVRLTPSLRLARPRSPRRPPRRRVPPRRQPSRRSRRRARASTWPATRSRRSCEASASGLPSSPGARCRASGLRAAFDALGAGPAVRREIDACVRRGAAPRRAPTPARSTPPHVSTTTPAPTPTIVATPAAPPVPRAPISGVRTGFVLGMGQHAAVGARPTHPLLFEVRDTVGAAVPGQPVRLEVMNGQLSATRLMTDTNGHVQVDLTLGPKVGPVQVSATVGAVERQATLYAEPGPAVQLTVRCGDEAIGTQVAFAWRGAVVLRVTARDGFANAAPVTGLQAAPGDRGVLHIAFVGADASGSWVRVEPRHEGSTSLVIVASGQ